MEATLKPDADAAAPAPPPQRMLLLGSEAPLLAAAAAALVAPGAHLLLIGPDLKPLLATANSLALRGAAQVDHRPGDWGDPAAQEALLDEAWTLLNGVDLVLLAQRPPLAQGQPQALASCLTTLEARGSGLLALVTRLAERLAADGRGQLVVVLPAGLGQRRQPLYAGINAMLAVYLRGLRRRLSRRRVQVITIRTYAGLDPAERSDPQRLAIQGAHLATGIRRGRAVLFPSAWCRARHLLTRAWPGSWLL